MYLFLYRYKTSKWPGWPLPSSDWYFSHVVCTSQWSCWLAWKITLDQFNNTLRDDLGNYISWVWIISIIWSDVSEMANGVQKLITTLISGTFELFNYKLSKIGNWTRKKSTLTRVWIENSGSGPKTWGCRWGAWKMGDNHNCPTSHQTPIMPRSPNTATDTATALL